MRRLPCLALLLLALVACSQPAPTPVPPTPSPTPTAAPTPTPLPTPTPQPTATPEPTPTPAPTEDASAAYVTTPGLAILPTPAMPDPAARPTPDPVAKRLDTTEFLTSTTRGLYALRPTAREIITREELRAYVIENLDEEIDDLEEYQQLYRLLGVIGEDVVLYDLMLSLYQESVLGFYDPEEERMFLVRDEEELSPRDVLTYAHEFTHSLQQQHFDIHSAMETLEDNSDEARAYRALIEGDASISERLYLVYRMSEEEQAAVQEASRAVTLDAFEAAPHLVKRLFYFPYVEGSSSPWPSSPWTTPGTPSTTPTRTGPSPPSRSSTRRSTTRWSSRRPSKPRTCSRPWARDGRS